MKSDRITIRLPAELKERLQQEADCKGYNVSDIVIFAILDYIQDDCQHSSQYNQR